MSTWPRSRSVSSAEECFFTTWHIRPYHSILLKVQGHLFCDGMGSLIGLLVCHKIWCNLSLMQQSIMAVRTSKVHVDTARMLLLLAAALSAFRVSPNLGFIACYFVQGQNVWTLNGYLNIPHIIKCSSDVKHFTLQVKIVQSVAFHYCAV